MRSRSASAARDDGFTLVELLVALTLIGGVLVALAYVLTGSMSALAAAKQRSAILEIANDELESLRSTPYASLGVLATDPDYTTQYPSGRFNGKDAVTVTGAGVPAARVSVATSPVQGVPVPFTIERWVTWTDTTGGTTHSFKQISVRMSYLQNSKVPRSIALNSLVYPGGAGTATAAGGGSSNRAPTARFGYSPSLPAQGATVTFTSTSTDPDPGDTLTYAWNFGDGSTSTAGPTTTHVYTSSGARTVTLTVSDNRGASATAVDTVSVSSPSNAPPVSNFTLTPAPGRTDAVNVNSTATDPDGQADIVSYAWDWGDGTTSTGVNSGHRYLTTGTFTIRHTVTDSVGQSDTRTVTQTVTSVGCTVISGSFRNPGTNSTANRIALDGNNKPSSSQFVWSVRTTLACTSVTANLPKSSGTFASPLVLTSSSSSDRTWTATTNVDSSDKFNTGASQTGEILASASTTNDTYSFSFYAG